MRIFRIVGAVLLAVIVFAAGCTTLGAAEEKASSPDQALFDTKQIRILKVLVAYDDPRDLREIKRVIQEASSVLEKQIGVKLEASFSAELVVWTKHEQEIKLLRQLYQATIDRTQEFDIAVGFISDTGSLAKKCAIEYCQEGAIDNTFRRFIVLRRLHPWYIVHEIGHAFILGHLHSDSGIMKVKTVKDVKTVSGANVFDYSYVFTTEDYVFKKNDIEEALRNKWRKFNEEVYVVPGPRNTRDRVDWNGE